jgi:hypothetical protein
MEKMEIRKKEEELENKLETELELKKKIEEELELKKKFEKELELKKKLEMEEIKNIEEKNKIVEDFNEDILKSYLNNEGRTDSSIKNIEKENYKFDDLLNSFTCPISLEIMEEPVILVETSQV